MKQTETVFLTDLITMNPENKLDVRERQYVIVKDGIIEQITPVLPEAYKGLSVTDLGRGVMIPAFSDLHIHAPQYTQRGIGMDCLLFDWLTTYTFPEESKFGNIEYARRIYAQLIRDMLRNGTMHASFFTTLHYEACALLLRMLEESGMQAYCGINNMDRNTTEDYVDTTAASLEKTERFLRTFGTTDGSARSGLVRPILTPRFAPTCSKELLMGLGKLAGRYGVGVQTHLVESKEEAEWAHSLFPEYASDGEIYEKCGLLGNGPAIFAHVIFPTEVEKRILEKYKAVSVHCPDATTNITAGIMPFSTMKEKGLSIALGSDIGGGHHPAISRQIARAVQLSKMKEYYEPDYRRIRFEDAFEAATVTDVFDRVGRLAPGYRFDALIIDGMEDDGRELSPQERLEKYCYIGDDRNITARYMNGKLIDPEEICRKLLEIPIRPE